MHRTAHTTVCASLVIISLLIPAAALVIPAAALAVSPAVTARTRAQLELPAAEEPVIQPLAQVAARSPLDLKTSVPSVPVDPAPSLSLASFGFNLAAIGNRPEVIRAAQRFQCVTFARQLTGFNLFGDAKTWWAQARGLYDLLAAPKPGAVMVFAGTSRMRHGHVAVVKEVVSSREVRVDHANWGDDGKVYLNMPVIDVSAKNDWSLVRVWNTKTGGMGSHAYPIKGFVAE